MKKQLLLSAIATLVTVLFFLLPQNYEWLRSKIFVYWSGFLSQKNNYDPEHRKQLRWQNNYTYSKTIATHLKTKGYAGKALVLMPPTAYFKAHGIEYHVPEPAVFYYYTGLKTVWVDSKQATGANWLVRAGQGKLIIEPVTDKQKLQDSIRAFIKYGVSL